MDYFTDVFTMFLSRDRGNILAVFGGSELSDFIKNILICVQRWTKVLRVWNDMRVSN